MKKIKKPVQIGVGLSLLGDAGDAAREATREAMRQAGLERADWAFCFFSTPHLGRADAVRDRVLEGSGCLALSGCSAMGVIGGGREVEGGAAVGVMVGCSPRIEARSALLPETWDGLERFLGGGAQQNRKTTLFALPDSYRVDNARMQQRLAIKLDGEGLLGANLFGAGATDDGSVGLSLQLGMEGVRSASIAMMRFDGDYEISVGITQSCTAVGDPHFITRADSGIDTMEDLKDRSFAFGRRSSVQAGLLAYSFLKDSGISPSKDLSANSFYEDRQSETKSDERDVVERVSSGEFDAGAVSQRVLETMAEDGTLARDAVRIFWSSPGYSHCCFTSQRDLDPALAAEIESAFLSVTADDPVGKAVLEGEACDRFVPGTDIGWELIEKAAEAEGLI